MIFQYEDYRKFLKATLAEKMQINPQFSLRSFALFLGLPASTVSEVLSGKRNLSRAACIRVSEQLSLKDRESDYFNALVQLETIKELELKTKILEKIKHLNPSLQRKDLYIETFKLLSEWYHFPILESLELYDGTWDAKWLANNLGISPIQVEASKDLLLKLELIVEKEGKFYKTNDNPLFSSKVANEALRKFHKQMLEKAMNSITTQTNDEKYIGSETISFDEDQLDEANEIFEECFKRLTNLSNKSKKKNSVYHAGIQFFKVLSKKGSSK